VSALLVVEVVELALVELVSLELQGPWGIDYHRSHRREEVLSKLFFHYKQGKISLLQVRK